MVSMTPQVPASISRFRLGIRPASIHGSTRSQSRPSRPRTITLCRGTSRRSAISASNRSRIVSSCGSIATSTAPSGTPSASATARLKASGASSGHSAFEAPPWVKHSSGSRPTSPRTVSATPRRKPSSGVGAATNCHTPTGGLSDTTEPTLAPSAVAAGISATSSSPATRAPDHLGANERPREGTLSSPVSADQIFTGPSAGTHRTVAHTTPRTNTAKAATTTRFRRDMGAILPHAHGRPDRWEGIKNGGPKAPDERLDQTGRD